MGYSKDIYNLNIRTKYSKRKCLMTERLNIQQQISTYAAEDPVVRLALQKKCPNDFEAKDPLQNYQFYLGVDLIRDIDKTFPAFFDLYGSPVLLHRNRIIHEDIRPWAQDTYRMVYPDGLDVQVHVQPTEHMMAYATDPDRIDDFFVLVDKETQWPLTRSQEKTPQKEVLTSQIFDASVDAFFLYMLDAAKGLVRKYPFKAIRNHTAAHEILYTFALEMAKEDHGADAPLGVNGEQIHKFMPLDLWALYQRSQPSFDPDTAWEAIFNTLSLFRKVAMALANKAGFTYPRVMDVQMVQVIRGLWQALLD